LSEAERDLISEKMAAAGISNREAYMRKMICDGYVVRLDFSDVREMVRLLRINSNNLNQVAKRSNETRSIYAADIKDLQDNYEKLWQSAETIMKKLTKL
jgi:DNA invertase Pin-like site-specific DNA recombinase